MSSFNITGGNVTFSIPSEITVEGEVVELAASNIRDSNHDFEGNLAAIEFNFETESTGSTSLTVSFDMYGNPNAYYGTLEEQRGEVEYEHQDDCPYDSLPEGPVPEDFMNGLFREENPCDKD